MMVVEQGKVSCPQRSEDLGKLTGDHVMSKHTNSASQSPAQADTYATIEIITPERAAEILCRPLRRDGP